MAIRLGTVLTCLVALHTLPRKNFAFHFHDWGPTVSGGNSDAVPLRKVNATGVRIGTAGCRPGTAGRSDTVDMKAPVEGEDQHTQHLCLISTGANRRRIENRNGAGAVAPWSSAL